MLSFVWLAMPVGTWSRARDNMEFGDPQLREDAGSELLGRPGLGRRDALKVHHDNVLMQFSLTILETARKMGVMAVLENPHMSRLWLVPQIRDLERQQHVSSCIVDHCQYGTCWRRRTKLLTVHCPLILHQCSGQHGLCSRTLRPHQHLSGRCHAVTWSQIAEHYPRELCSEICRQVGSFRRSAESSKLERFFT